MSTSLQTIISTIKTVALANGFASVQELKLNLESNADTLLPKLFIKLEGIEYDKLLLDSAFETYKLDLILVLADSANPISDLKTLQDTLLQKLFVDNQLFRTLIQGNKITLEESDLSNERDVYSKYGGESTSLRMNVSNINKFGGVPCQ